MARAARRIARCALAGLVWAAIGIWADAAGAAEPAPTQQPAGVETYGDWKKICEAPPGSNERVCFVFQKVNFTETNSMLLQAVVGYFRSDLPDPVLILTAPLGTFLPPGLDVRVGTVEPMHTHFEVCMTIGCQASLRLDADKLALLSSHEQAEVVVRNGAKKQVSIPLSLKGLDKGVASLKTKPKD